MTALLDFKNKGFIGVFSCEKLLQVNHQCRMGQQDDWQE